MTRTVIATFPDADTARRAVLALGRAELAAGPTRVRVAAAGPDRTARLELRVEDSDERRAIALMRDHGADSVGPAGDGATRTGTGTGTGTEADGGRDARSGSDGGPLAAWGMAVADAVAAAMSGPEPSDRQVPGRGTDVPVWGNTPHTASRVGTGSGAHLSDTAGAGTISGTSSGPRVRAEPGTLARPDDLPPRDPRGRGRPRSDA